MSNLTMKPSISGAYEEKSALLITGSSLDELQALTLGWVRNRTRYNFEYFAPLAHGIFAWGFVSGLAPTLVANNITVHHVPSAAGTDNFLRGLILRHQSGAELRILTQHEPDHDTDHSTAGSIGRQHTESLEFSD
jgi:hypothetical protein